MVFIARALQQQCIAGSISAGKLPYSEEFRRAHYAPLILPLCVCVLITEESTEKGLSK